MHLRRLMWLCIRVQYQHCTLGSLRQLRRLRCNPRHIDSGLKLGQMGVWDSYRLLMVMWCLLCSAAELPEGCWVHKPGNDGILDCLRYFKEAGYHVFLCTHNKHLTCRSRVPFRLSL